MENLSQAAILANQHYYQALEDKYSILALRAQEEKFKFVNAELKMNKLENNA